jgi:hypothetical protein
MSCRRKKDFFELAKFNYHATLVEALYKHQSTERRACDCRHHIYITSEQLKNDMV